MRLNRKIFIFFLMIGSGILHGSSQAICQESIRLQRISISKWLVEIECKEPSINVMKGLIPYSQVVIPDFESITNYGEPTLPYKKLLFGLPDNGNLNFKIVSSEQSETNIELLPYFGNIDSDISKIKTKYSKQTPLVTSIQNRSPNRSFIKITDQNHFDHLNFRGVEIFPVWYDMENKRMTFLKKMLVEITISGDMSSIASSKTRSHVSSRLQSKIINIDDARDWHGISGSNHVSGWYDPNKPYIKIFVNKKGIYRLTKSSLDSLGIDWSGIDPKTFQLFDFGVEQPLFVFGEDDHSFDTGDYLDFTGDMNHGERGEYFDYWSDENVYWLTWGTKNGKRFTPESITASNEQFSPSVIRKIHLEKDSVFHFGDNDAQGDISEFFPGKTWIWKYLLKKDSLIIPFRLSGVETTSQQSDIFIRLKGSSSDNSRIQIFLNNNLLEQFDIGSTELLTKNITFPQSLLKEGNNTLLVYNAVIIPCPDNDPTCSIERFYVDWVDVQYHYNFKADSDRIIFRDTVSTSKYKATLSNFGSDQIVGYNSTSATQIVGYVPIRNNNVYQFDGAFQPSQEYNVATIQALRTPVRIQKDISSDWSSSTNGADYIIVTHANFIKQADRLAQYRKSKDGFRTVVVNIDDLYDEFNFGMKHPVAIKAFVKTAYENWVIPRPKFITILGDASWDPKFLIWNSVKVDYIPSYGPPADDNYFVAFNTDSDIVPKLILGRIPCETGQAADDVIDKIIAYESQPLQHFNKKVLMVNGGKDVGEHQMFRGYSEAIIRLFLDPFCYDYKRIYRTSDDIISYAELDSIITEVNAGCLWFNFVGHGGTRIIDVGVDRPELFLTKDRYPFFVTMSCNTSHFAEPFETGLNEQFIMAKNNGSICSFGTSGRGVVGYDDYISNEMFRAMIRDSVRTFGEISFRARESMALTYSENDQSVRNTVNQYVILGDPATHIPMPINSELSVSASEIQTLPEIITDNSTAVITATLHNDGLCINDSVTVEFKHVFNNSVLESIRKKIAAFPVQTTINTIFDFKGLVGTNDIIVTIDPDNKILEKNKSDNTASIQRIIIPESVHPVFPLDDAMIHATGTGNVNIDFVVANPALMKVDSHGNLIDDSKIELQVSSEAGFKNIVTASDHVPGKTFTTINIPLQNSIDKTLWWRVRLISTSTTNNWSIPRSFTFGAGTGQEWYQNTTEQLSKNILQDCNASPDGTVRNSTSKLRFEVVSGGSRNVEIGNFADIKINGINVSPNRRGFDVAVVNRTNGKLIDTTSFDTYWSSNYADDMADYLDKIDSTKLIIVAVKDDANGYPPVLPGGTNLTQKLKSRMKEFGASLVDSIKFRGSYSFIGVRGIPGYARQAIDSLSVAVLKDTIEVNSTKGSITSSSIGPATEWKTFSFKDSLLNLKSSIEYSIFGSKGNRDTLLLNVDPAQNPVSLAAISAKDFPYLKIKAELNDTSGIASPILDWWKVGFNSLLPELGINSQSVFNQIDSILEGVSLEAHVQVSNAGFTAAQQVPIVIKSIKSLLQPSFEQKVIIPRIDPNTLQELVFQIPTTGFHGLNDYEVRIDPSDSLLEYYANNNYFSKEYFIQKDSERPVIEVLFDGNPIVNNDYVSPNPEISLKLFDNSPLMITDTSSMQLFLDGRRIFLMNNPQVQYATPSTGKEKIQVVFTPTLSVGVHSLAVNGKDATGNFADTLSYQVRFYVSNSNRVDQLFPYPNPTSGPTAFTFRIIGTTKPDRGKIKIYTVAGRLIKEIDIHPNDLRIGFNRINWDGSDNDGDRLGNGIYFYKLILEQSGREESFIDKIAVVR